MHSYEHSKMLLYYCTKLHDPKVRLLHTVLAWLSGSFLVLYVKVSYCILHY